MVQIPTARDVGYAGTRSGRVAPNGPSVSVGAAMAGAGQQVVRAAFNLQDLADREKQDVLGDKSNSVSTAMTRFLGDEEQRFVKSQDTSSESGIGFTRSYIEGWQQRADDFAKNNFEGLSDDEQTRYLNTLISRGNDLYAKADSFENKQKGAYYDRTTNQNLDTVRTQIRSNAANFGELKTQGLAAIDSTNMPEAWKAERRAKWDADAAESKWRWKFANNPQHALDEIRGTGGTDPVIMAMADVESSGNPNAVSNKGAAGLMQVMPDTGGDIAKALGDTAFPIDGTDAQKQDYLKDPEISRRYGEEYYKQMLGRYSGDKEAALIAYNGGQTRADAWLAAGRDDSAIPKESADYYKKVLGATKVNTFNTQDVSSAKVFLQGRTDKDASHIDGMQDGFAVKLSRMIQAAPPEIRDSLRVVSGARSNERQAELWKAALEKYGSIDEARRWVAPPGKSEHNKGDAADLGYGSDAARQWAQQNAGQFGLKFPLSNENWHIEDANTRGGKAKPYDPDIDAIPYDRRDTLINWGEGEYTRQQNVQKQEARGFLDTVVANAPAAIQNTGTYQNAMPTPEQFTAAYGPQEGAQRYDTFRAAVETSQQAYKFQTMPESDISTALKSAEPTSTGNDAELETKRYDALSKAAAETIKQREADPATYTQRAFPAVAQAWQDAANSGNYGPALSVMAATQQQLGIRNMQLMPKQVASGAIDKFKNGEASGEDRLNSVAGLVFSTSDPAQRQAVYKQLVDAGLPQTMDGVFEAMARGDRGAANRLMEAVITDPAKLPNSKETTPAAVTEGIYGDVWAPGEIGYTAYGLSYGDATSLERAQRGTELLNKAVRLRMARGEDLQTSISGAKKDLFGDKVVFSGGGSVHADLAVGPDVDQGALVDGLAASRDTFKQALTSQRDTAVGKMPDRFMADAAPAGLVEKGNIDLTTRPKVKNEDGSVSTVRSMSFEEDGSEILVPTVSDDGRILTDDEAINAYRQTGRFLGKFKSANEADKYAETLHKQQDAEYVSGAGTRAILDTATENRINDIVTAGVFVQTGDGIGLRDPYTGQFVAGDNGKPLTLKLDDILKKTPATGRSVQMGSGGASSDIFSTTFDRIGNGQ